jgi:FAD/FMN-containing dehydrogenase/Fe-S oxidoreductase
MNAENTDRILSLFAKDLKGDFFVDIQSRSIYATDASAYRELPLAVARPADDSDIRKLIQFAAEYKTTLIPRTAGTSLAGQVVGNGIVVDVSRYMTQIMQIIPEKRMATVQPGVILDELNMKLAEHGLFFAPETSSSNRCMIGGMVGNNACGSHSLIYGSTRDHLLSVKAFLSNGETAVFEPLSNEDFFGKMKGNKLENLLYRDIYRLLSSAENRKEIRENFPDPAVKRRNTGYAIDLLSQTSIFEPGGLPFNFSSLLAGSEGTLAFTTEVSLNLIPLPPKVRGLLCAHFHSVEEALLANLVCLKYNPGAVELMDHTILECTKSNIEQRKNRFFLQGEPGAILIVEFARDTMNEILDIKTALERDLKQSDLGYHFPLVTGDDIPRVWALRKSGLGVLSNLPGDAKPVSLVEDTAVRPDLLPDFIREIRMILGHYNLNCVFHAHAGTGELHMRPVLNLKEPAGVELFRRVASDVAWLVKKYRGSFSGEHGDGRLRGEFIPIIVGDLNYEIMRQVKKAWDPQEVFNKGKIVDVPAMDTCLRYGHISKSREFPVVFDYPASNGFIGHIEQCNGSGDCRKSALIGGTMCPSYMATRDENTTTRARTNVLREYLYGNDASPSLSLDDVYDILDLCLSCKGCKSECPSNVDMAKIKSEFLQHFYDRRGVSWVNSLIAHIGSVHKLASHFPYLYNKVSSGRYLSALMKYVLSFSQNRKLPLLSTQSLGKWFAGQGGLNPQPCSSTDRPLVCLFLDEFTNYIDAEKGIAAIKLLSRLGYHVEISPSSESGRTYISKGFLRKARKMADQNILAFRELLNDKRFLVGIEPSAILTFRDEYPDLVSPGLRNDALGISKFCITADEFISAEFKAGRIRREQFTNEKLNIKLHGHCQQKSISSTEALKTMLTIPENYTVEEIRSGCCGMAGAFGYEKRHYDLSMQIGELVLFPAIRSALSGTVICASGTSCRQQILDGTGVMALHPVEVLYNALK